MAKKKGKIDETIVNKNIQCSCKGNCKYRVNNRVLNNFKIDYCSENLIVLQRTKLEEA